MKEITLTRGQVAFVDDDDFERVSQFKWFAIFIHDRWYASSHISGTRNGKRYLHRFIMGEPKGQMIDHIDGDGLNCQKYNMRITDHFGNARNRRSHKNTSGYKGVRRVVGVKRDSWVATIKRSSKNSVIGTYQTDIDAAIAYDIEAQRLFGQFACLNFQEIESISGSKCLREE